ncbi:conserved hypothetical protein [Theileria orientalis strain Shintoku]|uniref:PNPLA domain-containing protein n=1 Tax=Theileria orientalis strain Shintoku TaxID=869250 RepID=J4CDS7_THEOR|nr:conserved hypothetical protein [Theileria orientalis strain Shintoku]PVC53721.1 hypothetical protein MACL_00003581 [Theileria orientalis]BAM41662.1 conserved hypothetical protein [Theileria orientalis strain Shintoku]|eukprot:XP_009691963.1 conserved hypothetical protein [Theileria orientalis strain Shintoku]
MSDFKEWQGLSVYSGDVISHSLPKDTLTHFNLEVLRKILNRRTGSNDFDLNSIAGDYSVRYALNYVLSNFALRFDRQLTSFIRSNDTSRFSGKSKIRLHRMFNSELLLMYLNPNVYREFGNSNQPSYYHLFLSLLSSVNAVIVESSEPNLAELKASCHNMDSCSFSRVSDGYINDMLKFYRRIGALELSEDYVFGYEGVRGVSLLDKNKLTNVGGATSDIGFSFSPSGFLIPYHLGVLSYLCEHNAINCTVPIAGASSGSLSVCSSVILNGFINCMNVVERFSKRLRSMNRKKLDKGSVKEADSEDKEQAKNLDDLVRIGLSEILKEGSHQFINERIGALTVGYSVIRRLRFKTMLNSHFLSVPDLIDCLRASSYIPLVSSKDFVYYKGEPCYDGQLSLNRSFGCPETNTTRVVRVNPYNFTSSSINKQRLLNEYITPHLTTSDRFLAYYVRLKSIIYQLYIRRLTLETLNMVSEFKNELIHAINLYNHVAKQSIPKVKVDRSKLTSYVETREYSKLSALWSSRSMMDLFVLVSNYENTVEVDKYNLRKYEAAENTDIVKTLGSSKFLKRPIHTSPVSLLTYLYLQLAQFLGRSVTEYIQDDPSSFVSQYSSICGTHQVDDSARRASNLVNLLTLLVPPLLLIYNYSASTGLLCNNVPKKEQFNISLYSSDEYQLRFFYDLGKTDAFRWIIKEYVKFENYLYLRILQLMKCSDNHNTSHKLESPNCFNNSHTDTLLHNKQRKLLTDNLILVTQDNLDEQLTRDSVYYRLFSELNNAVRSVIMDNSIDSHFSHILSHSHFWNYNKQYRF